MNRRAIEARPDVGATWSVYDSATGALLMDRESYAVAFTVLAHAVGALADDGSECADVARALAVR